MRRTGMIIAATLALTISSRALAQDGLIGKINLMSSKDVAAVKGEWCYHVVTTGVGPMKNEIEPKAHGTFDDSKWEILKPETLGQPRGVGGYSWCWYRIKITIPETVGGKPFEGGPVWMQTTVDDYGEIWVDGEIDRAFGKSGRGAVSGFNSKNRVRLQKPLVLEIKGEKVKGKRDAKPGDVFQIAVLGINAPLGNPPGNQIFLRTPTNLEFFSPDAKDAGADVPAVAGPPPGEMFAEIDLMKKDGVELAKGEWRRHPVTVTPVPRRTRSSPRRTASLTTANGKWSNRPISRRPTAQKNSAWPGIASR